MGTNYIDDKKSSAAIEAAKQAAMVGSVITAGVRGAAVEAKKL